MKNFKENREIFESYLENGEPPFNYERILTKEYNDRIVALFDGKNPVPYEIEIQPSAKCNANCNHCWGKSFNRLENDLVSKKNIDFISKRILEFQDEEFSLPRIKFCGSTGDPLTNPFIGYFVEKFYGKRKTRLFTNGIAIGKNSEDLGYLSSLAKLDILYLSLDAGTTDVLWRTKPGARRRGISLDSILDGSRRMKELNPDLKVNVSYVITNSNFEDIVSATENVKDSGLDLIRFRIDLTNNNIPPKRLDYISNNLKRAKRFQDDSFLVVPIHSDEEIKAKNEATFGTRNSGLKCYTNLFWTCIGPDGKVYPCGHIVNPETKDYGSLFENTFKEVWSGKRKEDARKCLPGKFCSICSPFSLRTNKFMSFLDSLDKEESIKLINL